jgi:hypothetical protein
MSNPKSLANGLGIAAFVVGTLSIIFSFIPCIGMYATVPAFIALILSIIAFVKARETDLNKGLIIAAIVISTFAVLIGGWQYTLWTKAQEGIEDFSNDFKNTLDSAANNVVIDADDIIDEELDMALDSMHNDTKDIHNAIDSMKNE